jgi:tetratricopeptide (TPR) repeat protein
MKFCNAVLMILSFALGACASTPKSVGQVAPDGRDVSLQFSRDSRSMLFYQPVDEALAVRTAFQQRQEQTIELLASIAELSLIGNRPDEAAEQARSVLKRDFKNAEAMKTLLKVFILGKRYHEALLLAENALQIRPRDADIICLKGLVFYLLEDSFSARDSWKKVLEIDAGNLAAQMNLAALYFLNRNVGQAGSGFDRVLAIQPHNPDALVGKALVLDLQGNSDEARRLLNELAVTNKKSPLVNYNLAVIERERFEDYESAFEHMDMYLREASKDRGNTERAIAQREELRSLIAKKKAKKLSDDDLRELAKKSSQTLQSTAEDTRPSAPAAGAAAAPVAPVAPIAPVERPVRNDEVQSLEDAIR